MKNKKRNKINQIFSSVLVIGFIVCSYFFSSLAMNMTSAWGIVVYMAIFVVFGLLLFYATRVGEGKAVKRFSLSVLLLVDLPALYIILATYITFLPLNAQLAEVPIVAFLAAVALGYGIPYTFLSGFELEKEADEEEEAAEEAEDEPILEGGLAEELLEAQKEDEESDGEKEDAAEDETEDKAEDEQEASEKQTDEEVKEDEKEETSEEEEEK